jgi:cytochrome c oxidase assembly protein subunit 15
MERRGLSTLAWILSAATFLLVVAGGLVTSTGSGLSVPDWPTTYGWNMFTFPLSKWVGNIRFEHSHRLIASAVGLLTVAFAVAAFATARSRAVRLLAAVAVGAVVLQGILGGLTVRYLLPPPISVAHACLAQTFFCLTVTLAVLTGRDSREPILAPAHDRRGLSAAAFSALFVQLVLGAWMRHSAAGLAIPDFPSSFGRAIPPRWDGGIGLAFAHRAWALVVAALVAALAAGVLRDTESLRLRRPAAALLALLPLQIALGAASVWTARAVPVTVAHVAVGAMLLATTAALSLRLFRAGFPASETVSQPAVLAAESAR